MLGAAALILISFTSPCLSQLAKQVDPFLGVDKGGNTFPGATLPFGMAKPGPDMDVGINDWNAGWAADGPIKGFSQTHVSGTGGGPKYGNILIQPTIGSPAATRYSSDRENEQASAGFYRVTLKRYPVDVRSLRRDELLSIALRIRRRSRQTFFLMLGIA